MRKFVYLSGAFSVSLFVLGCFFRILHTTFGGTMVGISMLLFSLVFVPATAVYYYKKGK